MKTLITAIAALSLLAGAADARSYTDDHHGWGHEQRGDHRWKRGEHMGYNNWHNAPRVDYRAHHLSAPPRGYEWRQSNGNYVLAAVATGIIASVILNGGR